MPNNYKTATDKEMREKLDGILASLPDFCRTYVRAREGRVSARTLYTYIQHLNIFFAYLVKQTPEFYDKKSIQLSDLAKLNIHDYEDFSHYIRHGNVSHYHQSSERTVNNYLSALSSFLDYFVRCEELEKNPVKMIERSKIQKKQRVIHLEADEQADMLHSIQNGTGLSPKQNQVKDRLGLSTRDACICMILIRTGLRVSELVGLDIDDINLKECSLHVLRKRGKEDTVYFDDATKEMLVKYLEERKRVEHFPNQKALFLVSVGRYKGERLSVRSVERLVKKYALASSASAGAKITPHKLRATFACDMLEATGGDLYLTQQAMNHDSPETTIIYLDETRKKLQASRNLIQEMHEKNKK